MSTPERGQTQFPLSPEEAEKARNPITRWRPTGSRKKYDPNDPHFNPMHPPDDTPKEVLEDFWGETYD